MQARAPLVKVFRAEEGTPGKISIPSKVMNQNSGKFRINNYLPKGTTLYTAPMNWTTQEELTISTHISYSMESVCNSFIK
jgi:hypothetical protein